MCKYYCSLCKDLIGVLLYHKYNTFSYNKKIFTRIFSQIFYFFSERKTIRISRCDFYITKSVPDLQPLAKFFPCGRRSRGGPMGPPHRGSGGREPISPGEGGGKGPNSLPRTTRIAVWEIFSGAFAVWEIFSESPRVTGK